MRLLKIAVVALVLPLCACDKNTVKTCEAYIQGGLKAPSTYKRVSLDEHSSATTYEQLVSMGKDPRMVEVAKKMSLPAGPLHMVRIRYDADNAMGVPLRDEQVCYFEGEEPIKAFLDSGLFKAEQRRDGTCCLS